ncbi:carbohydrate esterase family 5 protein [Hyaloscypha variabilis F]|uniref:Carbohydrate esterase family 5 protein n=1 Tax=Hyaloscypha variabilis (strain UAMH 11265 / GT02V1 / F) TaxID=1149755 RepID=A0A2J6R7B1_HYAVF|nr:carbohydrate esterase family 5 protein [Hyaloscypha variabilis F]
MQSLKTASLFLLAQAITASPVGQLQERSCPGIHVFGARETTASPGYGSAGTVVDLILNSHSGSTAEAINYPACGGQASCDSISYASSVIDGISAVVSQVNTFNEECPDTQLVLVGYSQGGQIFDDSFCGGGDLNEGYTNTAVPLSASAVNMIKAAIFMGDPRYRYGFTYDVGTCTAYGFAARPAGFVCPSGSKIKSYCDASDPYCCNGDNPATHQGYGAEYGERALAFVNSLLS